MERNYPVKWFWFFVLNHFVFHFFYLSLPGSILCIIGIWRKPCLWIGLAILGLTVILSIIEQLRIRKAALTQSDNPFFNEVMDAFCGPDGMNAAKKVFDEKILSSHSSEEES